MILENFKIPEFINKNFLTTGIDSLEFCLDKDKFLEYPHKINYNYNSRGYRDQEWPVDDRISDAIWCIGDSFTVGVGLPFEHTWPQVLKQRTGIEVINVSMDGASNEWIKRKTSELLSVIAPKNIVIMWSYSHRRETNQTDKTDYQRRIYHHSYANEVQDFVNFRNCINHINKLKDDVIHLVVPNAFANIDPSHYEFEYIKNYIGMVETLDYARDNHHFGLLTSESISELVVPLLTK